MILLNKAPPPSVGAQDRPTDRETDGQTKATERQQRQRDNRDRQGGQKTDERDRQREESGSGK